MSYIILHDLPAWKMVSLNSMTGVVGNTLAELTKLLEIQNLACLFPQ